MTPACRRGHPSVHDAEGPEVRHSQTESWDATACGQAPCPHHDGRDPSMAVIDDVRPLGAELERSYPVYVRGRLKFRVGQIVYVAFSLDETVMGFAYPKEERAALVEGQPDRFRLPQPSDLRFNWVEADLAALDPAEAREFVVVAWRMVVPKKLSRAYDLAHPEGPG